MFATSPIITGNAAMQRLLDRLQTIAGSDAAVLLVGETGVGKERFADYIHENSPRNHKPFVKLGLASMPRDLAETELFGHERGAFTGAWASKKGLFELAHGGSIFLDDIDDCPVEIQPKLLRVLENHEVLRLGGAHAIPVDVRLVSATKDDLRLLADRGAFRADLYYRISEMPIEIPPLRLRSDDVPLLADAFLRQFCRDRSVRLAQDALELLVRYPWPGNVRELRNVMRRVALFADDVVNADALPPEIRQARQPARCPEACLRCFVEHDSSFADVIACVERRLLQHALTRSGANGAEAARLLKMKTSTFRDKVRRNQLVQSGR